MSGLVTHTGNRLELLLEQLARDIRSPRSSVFEPEIIITQSSGMARWVAMELAHRQRISANLAFPFPNAFLSMLCEQLSLKTAAPEDPFDPTIMAFTIMKKLPARLSRTGYENLRNYFQDDNRQTKLLQLSQKIAYLFDQYLVFRPDTITGWDQGRQTGENETWQGDLWRVVATGNEHLHRVSLHKQLINALENDNGVSGALPERVSVFGISYLPEFHLQIMTALSKRIPVNWYFLSPCRQYWGEVVSHRDIRRIREKYAHDPLDRTDLHLDQGNPLLASMGTLGRDFLGMIAESGCIVQEHYTTPGRETLLNSVQSDILDMLDATGAWNKASGDSSKRRVSIEPETDNSIEIHVCHSPMREIEVLHDHILDAFQCLPDLKPRDILVMSPDIDTYAPFIQAVFDNGDPHRSIPFSLADRSGRFQSRIMDAFFSLIDLGRSRMEADKIIGLLDYPALRKQFNLDERDTVTIGEWVRELNIRWGIDADDRKKTAVPFFIENTWKSGLDRLLLGYAMPGQERNLFAGLLPHDHVEGDQGRLLGSFLEFFTCILKSAKELQSPKTLHAWATSMRGIVDCMFLEDEVSERELTALKKSLGRLEALQRTSGFDAPVELETVTYHLQNELENASFGSGFLAGKVTFCAMLPMRSIPFEVICLIGMHGNAFPRDESALGFDLMAARPRRGDRSRRNDDKYLFLEAIMSARNKFYISYIGRDIQDNSPISPSVLVSELIDYVGSGYAFPENRLVRQHPLQAFSADYFKGNPDLFSYSAENFAAATAALQPPARPDKKMALPEPSQAFRNITVEALGAFYANPTKYFLQHRLGIYLEKESKTPDSSENFRMGGIATYTAGQESLQFTRSGGHPNDLMKQLRATGMLPPGRVGEHDFSEIAVETANFVARAHALSGDRGPVDSPVSLRMGDFSISGSIAHVHGHGLVHVRFANFNPRDLVICWINHLLLCAGIDSHGLPRQGFYLCRNASVGFDPPDNCRGVLSQLLTSYWDGLSRPLPFFPKSAYVYARSRLIENKSPKHALQAAHKAMQGTPYTPGEIQEPYVNFYCGDTMPLDERFEAMSLDVFEPLFDHYTSTTVAPPLQLKDAKHL